MAPADRLVDLGLLSAQRGDLAAAAGYFRQATATDPAHAAAFVNLGTVSFCLHDLTAAATAFATALEIDAEMPQAHLGLAAINGVADRLDDAVRHSELALAMEQSAEAYGNAGVLYRRQGDRSRALAAFEQALSRDPGEWLHHFNHGVELLVAGRFAEGWEEFEHRLRAPPFAPLRGAACWSGEATPHLMVHHEQGFGDTMQFCRYIDLASERCERLSFVVHPELVTLLRSSFSRNPKVAVLSAPPASFDSAVWVGSLMRIFGAGTRPIPVQPYLSTASGKPPPALGARLRVGLAWAGRKRPDIDSRRSMPAAAFDPIRAVQGIDFVSLQKQQASDWAATAAAVDGLDLIISVDTAVAHLAGAMGKPVWLLNRIDTCWRWLLNRQDSIWYPTMRIFRQTANGDWRTIVATAAGELARLRDGHEAARPATK